MSERIYYVLCADNCKFEGMTKEQIYDAIAEATGSTPTGVDDAFITKIKEQNANHNLKIWKGTEAQYNALGTHDADTLYIIGTNIVKENYLQAVAFSVTLTAAAWSDKEQTVSDANFFANGYAYTVSPASSSFVDYGSAQIYADDIDTDGEITFHCGKVPTVDLTVNVIRVVA